MTKEIMRNITEPTVSEEISLKDTVEFINRNWKKFIVISLIGLSLAATYLVTLPERYEAYGQIKMAQLVATEGNAFNNASLSNIEEPSELIHRLRSPTTYPLEVKQSCGIPTDAETGSNLSGRLKVEVIKGVSSAVQLTARAPSYELARKCVESVKDMIVAQQRHLIRGRLSGRQVQLAHYQESLAEEMRQLANINTNALRNVRYLASLDQISWLRTRIDALQQEASLSQLHPATLISPIYVPNHPVPRKSGLVLTLGALAGLLFGVMYALGCEGWRRMKME